MFFLLLVIPQGVWDQQKGVSFHSCPEILMHNIGQLGVGLEKVEQIVISHNHYDHTGGLDTVLEV